MQWRSTTSQVSDSRKIRFWSPHPHDLRKSSPVIFSTKQYYLCLGIMWCWRLEQLERGRGRGGGRERERKAARQTRPQRGKPVETKDRVWKSLLKNDLLPYSGLTEPSVLGYWQSGTHSVSRVGCPTLRWNKLMILYWKKERLLCFRTESSSSMAVRLVFSHHDPSRPKQDQFLFSPVFS